MFCCATYQRRRPEEAVLNPCITRHWSVVRARCEEADQLLPHFVEREFESYLRYGFLEHGFARIHCSGCGHERLVAFSCKGCGFCPSCGGRRLTRAHPWAPALRAAMALQAIPS